MRCVRELLSPMVLTTVLTGVIPSHAAWADPPGRIGRLSYATGSVSFRAAGVDDWAAATLNYPVTSGDELWSDTDARAEVDVGSSTVRLGGQTLVDFLDVSDHSTQIRVTQGSLYLRVRQLLEGDRYEVDTPNAALSLLGPGHYRIDVSSNGQPSTITVRDGSAEVITGGTTVSVHPGESVVVTGVNAPSSAVTVAVAADAWERWCESRDQREDLSTSLRYLSPGVVGFEDLDDYGTWLVDPTFGPVWVPTVAAGWAPYHFGRWGWVNPWGWTWIDDAPWGFAPFHYGRWAFLQSGWAWVPGEIVDVPIYAPALVAFVGGSDFDLSLSLGGGGGVAWFPLAPGEPYIPAYRVSRTYIREVNITNVKSTNLDFTNIDVTKVRYANRSLPGATTAVPRAAFLTGESVSKAAVRVSPTALAKATVIGTAAPVAPRTESLSPRATALPAVRPAPAPAIGTSENAPGKWQGPTDEAARRQWQAERSQTLARQAAERAELERRQQAELSSPPAGVSPEELRQRQEEERNALVRRHGAETDSLDTRYHGK